MVREVVFAACLFTATFACADGPLRWKLSEGDRFTVISSVESIQTTGAGDSETEMPVAFTFTTLWTVAGVGSDAYKINQQIQRVQLKLKYPGFDIAFDSDEKQEGAAEQLGKLLRPLVGATITHQLTARGEVLQVEIPKSLLGKLAENPLTKQMMSVDSMKSLFSQASVVLPTGTLQRGESWESEEGVATGLGELAGKTKYTYVGQRKGGNAADQPLSEIEVVHELNAATVDSPLGGKLAISEATGTGKIWFDPQAGHLTSITSKYVLSSKLELLGKEFEQTMQTVATTQFTAVSDTQVDAEE